jgi:hypothetical protein
MKQLTDKQKKIAWVVVGLLVFIHFALPRFINLFQTAAVHSAPAKPSPYQYAPAPAPPPPPPSPEVVAATKYGGIWAGSALMPDQNRCNIRLEIRMSDDLPRKLMGYESKSCVPVQPFAGGKLSKGSIADVIRATSPVSSVMTASVQTGGLNFTIEQTIGTPGDGCALTGFSITDFGQGQVMAQWQEGTTCPAEKMLLTKARG